MMVNTETHNWTNFKENQWSIQSRMEPRHHIPKAEGPLQQRGLVEKFVRARGQGGQEWNCLLDMNRLRHLGTHHTLATCTRPAQDQCSQHSSMRWEQAYIPNWGPIVSSQLLGEGVSVFFMGWPLKGWSIPSDGTASRRSWAAQIGVHELLKNISRNK